MGSPTFRYTALAGLYVLYLVTFLLHPVSAAAIQVKSGQSIQSAINGAKLGDWIFVEAGTYSEQLTINSSGIHLVGLGNTILVPPASPKNNTCSGLAGNGTEAGICITGADIRLAPFVTEHRKVQSVGKAVSNVLVTGFQVKGFSGLNVAVVGGNNTRVFGNHLVNGDQYGALTVGSNNTYIGDNIISSLGDLRFIGICMDDISGVQVSNNYISGYLIGLCIQTPGADVRFNDVSNGCVGAFVDPRVKGADVYSNHVSHPNSTCAMIDQVGISGIVIDGAVGTLVRENLIENLTVGADLISQNKSALGLALIDDSTVDPPALATNNTLTGNILRHNDLDIFVMTNGTGNEIESNICSTPKELCS